MKNAVNSVDQLIVRQKFFNKHMEEYAEKKVEFEDQPEQFQKWYDEEFNKFVNEWGYGDLFKDPEPEVVSKEDIPDPLLLSDPEKVVDVADTTIQSVRSVIDRVADAFASSEIIEPKQVKPGLTFDHLVVDDPEKAAATDSGSHTIKIEQNPVRTTMFDNSKIISTFPDMGRIQDIIRITEGWDVEMITLYNDFIVCTLYVNGAVTDKVFIVDYKGEFMNNIPKIFLIKGGFIDESEAIHLGDASNLINYLKGVPIIPSPEEIVTPAQRRIARYIVNYGTPAVPENFRNEFEKICLEKIVPFIESSILPSYPDASFGILMFKDPTHWELGCTRDIPFRFGEAGAICQSHICIHADGTNEEGKLIVTPHFH